jgi:SAM-dependent methyltransferase
MSKNKDYKHIDSWKNSKIAFKRQLQLNKKQLAGEFPPHWDNFVKALKKTKPKRVVDIGCGAGCYYPICKDLQIDYIGYDYSDRAVFLADEAWGWPGVFFNLEYQDINSAHIHSGDMVVANGLVDILPNGDECLQHLLSINADRLLIQRIRITDEPSYFTEYSPYDITTYEFFYNKKDLFKAVQDAGYVFDKVARIFNPSENVFDIEIRKPE